MHLNPLSDAHVDVLSWDSLLDSIDTFGKNAVKRLAWILVAVIGLVPPVTLLCLVLWFDWYLIVTGSYR